MKTISVRDIPPEVDKLIRDKVRRKGLSANRAVIELLRERAGDAGRKSARKVEHHDLDELAGSWTRDEAKRFERELDSQRKVDAEIWK